MSQKVYKELTLSISMKFDLKSELYSSVKDIQWNFVGILDTKKRLHEIPKNLNFQALFEKLVFENLIILTKKHKIEVLENKNIRSYPDFVLRGGSLGKNIIALDEHTIRGKKMGRGLDHFIKEGAKIRPAKIIKPFKRVGENNDKFEDVHENEVEIYRNL